MYFCLFFFVCLGGESENRDMGFVGIYDDDRKRAIFF